MTKDERIALLNADLAAGRITLRHLAPVKITRQGGERLRVHVANMPEGLTLISDTMQPLTSYRIEHAGRVMLCLLNGAMARVDGGDPGDEDWT